MRLEHFYETQQLSKDLIFELFQRAEELRIRSERVLDGKILATVFYEPSTRTRLSFESAMTRLGGSVLTTENAKEFSSAVKGESIEDTVRVLGSYADGIVLRHYQEGSSERAVAVSKVPIINAGDGAGQHPTQALLDLYTIQRELGRIGDLKVAMIGDLAFGRTVRSLSYLLGKLNSDGIRHEIIYVSPENLRIGKDIKEYLKRHGVRFREADDLNGVLSETDVVYMTRIQKERMLPEDFEMAKGRYVLNGSNLGLVRPTSRILHPLPHVEEIDLTPEVENSDLRIAYFRQVENGLFIRMALLENMLSDRQ